MKLLGCMNPGTERAAAGSGLNAEEDWPEGQAELPMSSRGAAQKTGIGQVRWTEAMAPCRFSPPLILPSMAPQKTSQEAG